MFKETQKGMQINIDEVWKLLEESHITTEQERLINKLVDFNIEIKKLCNE